MKSTVIWSSKTTWRTATTHFCTNCITRLRHVIIYSRSSGVGEWVVSSTQLWNKCANSSISTGTGIKTMCVNRKSSKNGSFGPTCPPNLVSSKCSSIFCGVPDITVYLANARQMKKKVWNEPSILSHSISPGLGLDTHPRRSQYNHNSYSFRSALQCAAFHLWFQREPNSKWNLHFNLHLRIFLFHILLLNPSALVIFIATFSAPRDRNSNWILEINNFFLVRSWGRGGGEEGAQNPAAVNDSKQ